MSVADGATQRRTLNIASRAAWRGWLARHHGPSGDAPPAKPHALPRYIERALRAEPRAWEHFQRLAPSYRRNDVGWLDSAKREDTKMRRLREAVALLAAGKKLGLK